MNLQDRSKFLKLVEDANIAAEQAGKIWLEEAKPKYAVVGYEDSPLLDLCGNAYVRIDDGRTKFAKFLKEEYDKFGTTTVPIYNQYRGRQEHGLNVAMARAACKVLVDNGIKKCYVWDWID